MAIQILTCDKSFGFDKAVLPHTTARDLAQDPRLLDWTNAHQIQYIALLDQVHGAQGTHLVQTNQLDSWQNLATPGDYLITHLPRVGLAIGTADCVPIMVYHPSQPVIAAIHMGWRGGISGVVQACLQHIYTAYGISADQLCAQIGPAARSCCYQISPELAHDLVTKDPTVQAHINHTVTGPHVDMTGWAQDQLTRAGMATIHTNPTCTIHTPSWCSHRREPVSTLRNITIVALV